MTHLAKRVSGPISLIAAFAFSFGAGTSLLVTNQDDEKESTESQEVDFDADQISEDSLSVQMHYIFGPSFNELKAEIGSESDDEINWNTVAQHALILSEMSSRLHRWPDLKGFDSEEKKAKYAEYWKTTEVPKVKRTAHEIYQLAKQKDITAKQKLAVLAENCNICHSKGGSWSPVVIKP